MKSNIEQSPPTGVDHDGKGCGTCDHWVPYNSLHAGKGECTNDRVVRMIKSLDDCHNDKITFLPPFDFCCSYYCRRPLDDGVTVEQCSPA